MAAEDSNQLEKQGKLIAVCSAKGGIGKTLISVNLALAFKKKNLDVTLVDGDFQFGDVCLALDLKPTFSIKDVIEEIDGISEDTIMNYTTNHLSSVKVLAAPDRPEYAELVSSEAVTIVIDALLKQNDYVIVDNGTGIQEQSMDILDKADEILIVTNLEMTALKNTKLLLEAFTQINMREKVQLVVNRYNMESLLKADEVSKMLGEANSFFIPNNFKIASQSMNLGIPFVSNQAKCDLSKAIFKMTESIISKQAIKPKEKKSFLHKILPRK
ncbi:CpaE family protein [Evansella sp. AB-rgal1]|uniref:AAA family ATPase n=1 Tax=Evansella sp. AB-rgal1 TaxID=3242696 RepID=UPI00359E2B75